MRKSTIVGVAIILTIVASWCLPSCSRESDNLDYSPQNFEYKAGSVWYTGGLTHAWYYDSVPAFKAEFYTYPLTGNYLFIEVDSANYLPPRVYNVGYDTATHTNLRLRFYTDGSHVYTSTSGKLTITNFDTITRRVSGTFQFSGNSNGSILQISGGQFDNLEYVKQ